MRVTGGALRGRRLRTVPGTSVRPTSDRVREALFQIVAGALPGAHVADLTSRDLSHRPELIVLIYIDLAHADNILRRDHLVAAERYPELHASFLYAYLAGVSQAEKDRTEYNKEELDVHDAPDFVACSAAT